MAGAWPALRDADRDLAFCLLFAPASKRDLLADRLLLALETEAAIRVASEPILAAIRIQWWCDALDTGRHENVPLMLRLLAHMESGRLTVDELQAQLALWQDRLQPDSDNPAGCWSVFFQSLSGGGVWQGAAGEVGAAFVTPADAGRISDQGLAPLNTGGTQWIRLLALLLRYRLRVPAGEVEPLLIWRLLGWRYGFRRPPAQPTSG